MQGVELLGVPIGRGEAPNQYLHPRVKSRSQATAPIILCQSEIKRAYVLFLGLSSGRGRK